MNRQNNKFMSTSGLLKQKFRPLVSRATPHLSRQGIERKGLMDRIATSSSNEGDRAQEKEAEENGGAAAPHRGCASMEFLRGSLEKRETNTIAYFRLGWAATRPLEDSLIFRPPPLYSTPFSHHVTTARRQLKHVIGANWEVYLLSSFYCRQEGPSKWSDYAALGPPT